MYLFTEQHTNKNDFIDDYHRLKKLLVKKYGKPSKDTHTWKNDLFKDDPQDWGMAICVGDLVYYSEWETQNTNIFLFLTGGNYEINHLIRYASKQLEEEVEKAREEETLEAF